jgi:hypothetical protein
MVMSSRIFAGTHISMRYWVLLAVLIGTAFCQEEDITEEDQELADEILQNGTLQQIAGSYVEHYLNETIRRRRMV